MLFDYWNHVVSGKNWKQIVNMSETSKENREDCKKKTGKEFSCSKSIPQNIIEHGTLW